MFGPNILGLTIILKEDLQLSASRIGVSKPPYTVRLYMGSYFTNIPDFNKSEYVLLQEFIIPVIRKHTWPGCIMGLENMYECLYSLSARNILGYI